MFEKVSSLLDQLRDAPGKAEIIGGEVVLMSPAGYRHHRKGNRIFRSLEDHELQFGGGIAFSDNLGFIVDLPHRESFSPDAGWLANPPAEDDDDFVFGAPTFAVEIRSKKDYGPAAEQAILAKISDYFAAGTLVVWDVDLRRGQWIRCYRATDPAHPAEFGRGSTADAEPAVPGWRFEVDELFR
jgi:Uma2 family endonuclease